MQRKLVKNAVLSLVGLLLLSALGAYAEPAPKDHWLLAKYDVNGDQLISVDEVEKKRKKMFAGMDIDADGGVSFTEYQEVDSLKRARLLQARFKRLDLDKDGVLSDAEYSSYLGSFERFDKNGDGNISGAEISRSHGQAPANQKTEILADHCILWFCVRKSLN